MANPDTEDLLAILERIACWYYTQGSLSDSYLRLEARIVDDLFRVLGDEKMGQIQSGCSGGMCQDEEP